MNDWFTEVAKSGSTNTTRKIPEAVGLLNRADVQGDFPVFFGIAMAEEKANDARRLFAPAREREMGTNGFRGTPTERRVAYE